MVKPIVITDSVGCRETVNDVVNGYLCVPRLSESLIQKLSLIINMSHDERLEMGLNS